MGSFLFDDITTEEFIELRAEERAEELANKRVEEIASTMKVKGFSVEQIAELTGLRKEHIENL